MAQHTHPLPKEGTLPSAWYDAMQGAPDFEPDKAQSAAIARLDQLHRELIDFKQSRSRLWRKMEILGYALLPQPTLPRGVYLWGGVGRGKSMLMDVFFSGLPFRRKHRVHFHTFMQDVHRQLRLLKGESDPLAAVAKRISVSVRVLCFDEFHVSDIADAMILGRLFSFLFNNGVVLVLTSNYAPKDLYPDGLQRASFLPTITLLQQTLDVINLDGGRDHRERALTKAAVYLVPINESNELQMRQLFEMHAIEADQAPEFHISGYLLKARRRAPGIAWFDFSVLCGKQRSQIDYLHIARCCDTVLVSGIPVMGPAQSAEARRLTWLVDVFYDYRVKLMVSAEASAELLYCAGERSGEFARTVSRLQEMQTEEYLNLPYEKAENLYGISET